VCTGTAVPCWLLVVSLHVVHRDSSTVLAAGYEPACCAQGRQHHTGCWLCAGMVCTGTPAPSWLLVVSLHVVHRDSSTVLAAGCVPVWCAQGQQCSTVCGLCACSVHRDSSTILAAGCVPAWCAQGQQYHIGCWLCACMLCTGTAVQYWLLAVCQHGVHRGSSAVLAAGCVPAWCAQGQQYHTGR